MGLPIVKLPPVAAVLAAADGEPELEAETGAVIRLDDDMAILMLFILCCFSEQFLFLLLLLCVLSLRVSAWSRCLGRTETREKRRDLLKDTEVSLLSSSRR